MGNFGSLDLVKHINKLLNNIGINNHLEYGHHKFKNKILNSYSVVIVGKKNLNKWMSIIGFNNRKHKTKYLIWKLYGFCPPKTILSQREKALKDNTTLAY